MRIGLVVINPQIGGVEKRFAHLFNHLSENSRHEFSLFLPVGLLRLLHEQGLLKPGRAGIVPLFDRPPASLYNHLPPVFQGVTIRGFTRALAFLWRRSLREERVARLFRSHDILHHALTPSFLLGSIPFDIPTVVEAQDPDARALQMPFMEEAYKAGAVFNFHSKRIQEEYEALTGRREPERFFAAPCSLVDYSRLAPGPKEKLVVFAARLERMKNPELFVEAVALLARRRRDFRARILGRGRLERRIRGLIASKGLGDLLPCGYHPRPREVLSQALVFASLQSFDNFGSQAIIEAMACGCAVVASDVGMTRLMVPEGTGLVVPLTAEAVADGLDRLLQDVDRTRAMGLAAREHVMREHTVDRYVRHLELLYEKAAGVVPPRRR